MIARASLIALALVTAMSSAALAQPPVAVPRPAAGQPAPTPRPPGTAETPRPDPNVQATTPKPAPANVTVTPPRPEGKPFNIRVEVTIADKRSSGAEALRKTITVVTADAVSAYIRSTAAYSNLGDVPLNVDVDPQIMGDGSKIRLRVNLQYDLPAMSASGVPGTDPTNLRRTQIRENLTVILENGKPVVAAQSADPVGDRQVTIEVKATVLR